MNSGPAFRVYDCTVGYQNYPAHLFTTKKLQSTFKHDVDLWLLPSNDDGNPTRMPDNYKFKSGDRIIATSKNEKEDTHVYSEHAARSVGLTNDNIPNYYKREDIYIFIGN